MPSPFQVFNTSANSCKIKFKKWKIKLEVPQTNQPTKQLSSRLLDQLTTWNSHKSRDTHTSNKSPVVVHFVCEQAIRHSENIGK